MDSTAAYEFAAPRQIVFGWGRRSEVGRLARTLGRRALLVSGSSALNDRGVIGEIGERLRAEGVEPILLDTISTSRRSPTSIAWPPWPREQRAGPGDLAVGIGGGAGMDLAKAVAAMATNRESPTVKDYLENVGRDLKIVAPPLPLLAMPTTAGTGAEATRNAVISSYDPAFKKSLRDLRDHAADRLGGPELTVSVPPAVTAASGMDAITQLLESYISRKAQPIPRRWRCRDSRWRCRRLSRPSTTALPRGPRGDGPCGPAVGPVPGQFGVGNGPWRGGGAGRACPYATRGLACGAPPTALRVNRESVRPRWPISAAG